MKAKLLMAALMGMLKAGLPSLPALNYGGFAPAAEAPSDRKKRKVGHAGDKMAKKAEKGRLGLATLR